MNISKVHKKEEVRFDVTTLFYPDIITEPGTTPLNIKEIRKKFDVYAKEQYDGKYCFVTVTSDNDDCSTWLYVDAEVKLFDIWEMLHKTAKEIYGDKIADFGSCVITIFDNVNMEQRIDVPICL